VIHWDRASERDLDICTGGDFVAGHRVDYRGLYLDRMRYLGLILCAVNDGSVLRVPNAASRTYNVTGSSKQMQIACK
jgi:hypothetical protein